MTESERPASAGETSSPALDATMREIERLLNEYEAAITIYYDSDVDSDEMKGTRKALLTAIRSALAARAPEATEGAAPDFARLADKYAEAAVGITYCVGEIAHKRDDAVRWAAEARAALLSAIEQRYDDREPRGKLLKVLDEYGDALFLAGGEQIAEQDEATREHGGRDSARRIAELEETLRALRAATYGGPHGEFPRTMLPWLSRVRQRINAVIPDAAPSHPHGEPPK